MILRSILVRRMGKVMGGQPADLPTEVPAHGEWLPFLESASDCALIAAMPGRLITCSARPAGSLARKVGHPVPPQRVPPLFVVTLGLQLIDKTNSVNSDFNLHQIRHTSTPIFHW